MATRHIVLGLDGATDSRAALQWCVGMAPLLDADVTAVHSLRPLIAYLPQPASGVGAPPNYDVRLHEQLALASHRCRRPVVVVPESS
jgi:Universal stress protein family